MKIIIGFVMVWLLCGVVAASLVQDTRSATLADVKWGPITLLKLLRA
jgi:hypothetical protein